LKGNGITLFYFILRADFDRSVKWFHVALFLDVAQKIGFKNKIIMIPLVRLDCFTTTRLIK
jgi:hypothetical protein